MRMTASSITTSEDRADQTALRLAQMKLPVQTEFITHNTPSRLGTLSTTSLGPPSAALPVPAQLAELDAKDEGGALDVILDREQRLQEAIVGLEGMKIEEQPRL